MIALLKTLDMPWEQARGSLFEDLLHIESAINQRWNATFQDTNKLLASTIHGDPPDAIPSVVTLDTDGNPTWAQVDLTTGITGRLPFANLVAATLPSVLLGRGSASAGDFQQITLGTGLAMSGVTLNATAVPHALLDGVQNNDTLAAGPTRGDLIVANSTPKWARFAVGTTGTFLQGGTDPAWAKIPALSSTYFTSLDSPIFTTQITTPKILGGTGTTQTLTYQTTSGVGAAGADHIFLVGNAGATEAVRIDNAGNLGIGTGATINAPLSVGNAFTVGLTGNFSTTGSIFYFLSNSQAQIGNNNSGGSASVVLFGSSSTSGFLDLLSTQGAGTTDYIKMRVGNNGAVEALRVISTGQVGLGVISPTSTLHLKAGTTTANSAPLQFTSGSLETVARAGVVEFLTDAWYGTITTGAARKTFAFLESPTFTGVPAAPTAAGGTNTTQIATTAFVTTANATNANLTGPVTSVGNATTITAAAVTLAMLADLAQDQFIGRTTASTGVPQTATITAAARTVLDDTTVAAMVDTLGGASSIGTGGLARSTSPQFVTNIKSPYFMYDTANYMTGVVAADTLTFHTASTERLRISATGTVKIGTGAATALLHINAGTATALSAPLKFTSGTNLTTAEAGAVEYNGTNLFFTRAGTVRENVLVAVDNATAPTTSIGVGIVNYYGSAATNFLGDPNRWLSLNILGTVYKLALYT